MAQECKDYLAHYGVKGQKWGTRKWQNDDGTYTEAGKHHYGWGYGRQSSGIVSRKPSAPPKGAMTEYRNMGPNRHEMYRPKKQEPTTRRESTPEEIAARKAKARTILAIAAGVAVAGLAAYGVSRGAKGLANLKSKRHQALYNIGKAKTYSKVNRAESMSVNGWSSAAEKQYRQRMRRLNRAEWKAFLGIGVR